MKDDSEDWRWADADGVQNVVDEWELVSSLSSGSLPHYTLVWKVGWASWLPACQVAELASAIPPDKAEKSIEPKLDDARKDPPAPPIEKYAAYQARDAASKLLGRASKSPTRPPPPPGSTAPGLGPGRGGGRTPPPAPRPRTPMPTLIEQPGPPATATLRPPGAVPPPPRGVPTQSTAREAPQATAIPTPIPMVPLARFGREPVVELAAEELESAPANELPTMPIATQGPIQVREKPEILMPDDDGPETTRPLPPIPELGLVRSGPRRPITAFWLLGAVGVLGIVAMMLVALVLMVKGKDEPTPVPSATNTGGSSTEASTLPCTLAAKAKKIAPIIHHGIPPYVSADPESGHAAIGFAASDKEAVGITVDLETLATQKKFSEQSREPITGVVPLTASGKLRFVVDRESGGLRFARTIDAKPPMTIGVGEEGFASVVGAGVPRTVWPGAEERRITEPRVARADGVGFVVTFRRGSQTGEVVVGWLGLDGSQKSPLAPVLTSRKLIGTPVVGANDREVLVAFSARQSDNAYWGLQVATAAHGEVPKRARPFSIPPGGLGAEAISPAVAGLSGGRWLLQWTEGSTGDRQVRLQTLGSDLIAVGDPVTLSPEQVNAGQGVVWVRGEKALSLFLVKVTSGHELWGALLKCP